MIQLGRVPGGVGGVGNIPATFIQLAGAGSKIYIWFLTDCTFMKKVALNFVLHLYMVWLVTMILLSFLPFASIPKFLLAAVSSLHLVSVDEGVLCAGLSHLLPLLHFCIGYLSGVVGVLGDDLVSNDVGSLVVHLFSGVH